MYLSSLYHYMQLALIATFSSENVFVTSHRKTIDIGTYSELTNEIEAGLNLTGFCIYLQQGAEGRGGDRWGDTYQNMPMRKMVALYDYDPHELSPNVDAEVSEKRLPGEQINKYHKCAQECKTVRRR